MESKKHLQGEVLQELRRHGNVYRAARQVGVTSRTINRWRQTDRVFKAAAEQALAEGRV